MTDNTSDDLRAVSRAVRSIRWAAAHWKIVTAAAGLISFVATTSLAAYGRIDSGLTKAEQAHEGQKVLDAKIDGVEARVGEQIEAVRTSVKDEMRRDRVERRKDQRRNELWQRRLCIQTARGPSDRAACAEIGADE